MASASWPYLAPPRPVAIAHRGSSAQHPENTMAAFQHAVDLGYRYIETDVHATSDGVLVAFHDDSLDRVSDRGGRIVDQEWTSVREARVSGSEQIPLLEDLLGAWADVYINIDAKADTAVAPLIRTLQRTDALDRVCIGSFSDKRLRQVRDALGSKVCTSMGPGEVTRMRLASLGVPTGSIAAACAQVPIRQYGVRIVDRRFVDAAHRRGLKVHVWTINDEDEMERLLDIGVDGIMTDETELLKTVFTRRGLWPE